MNAKLYIEKIYPTYKDSVYKACELMYKEFPCLYKLNIYMQIKKFNKEYSSRYAMMRQKNVCFKEIFCINLNEKYFSYPDIKNCLISNSNVNYYDVEDVIIHEFGHILHNCFISNTLNIKRLDYVSIFNHWKIINIDNGVNILEPIKRNIIATVYPEIDINNVITVNDEIIYALRSHATKDVYEFFAECFNNYYYLT